MDKARCEIAESLDDVEYQLRSLWGLWFTSWASGRHRVALALAQKFCALAANRSDPNDGLVGERLIGVSQHFLGELTSARHHLEHMLAHYVPPVQMSHIIRFQSDQRVAASTFLGRVLWLQGFAEQALRTAEGSVDDAWASRHAMSLSYVLAHGACPIALWCGDLGLAERYVGMLNDLSTRHSLARWRAFGAAIRACSPSSAATSRMGLRLLRSGFDDLGEVNASFRFLFPRGDGARLGPRRKIGQGLSALEGSIARAGETEERWDIAELLRVKGELLLLQCAPGASVVAEEYFRQALDWARRQGALSWELRAVMSMARLKRGQGQRKQARALLAPVYGRFTEGFDTLDLKEAKALLDELRA